MRKSLNRSRRLSAALFASVLATGAMTVAGVAPAAANPDSEPEAPKQSASETLGTHDVELLTEARPWTAGDRPRRTCTAYPCSSGWR